MRSLFLALLCAVPLVSLGQRSGAYGTVRWSISDTNALIWDGQPYVPTGVVADASADAIGKVAAAGIKDVLIDAPASGMGWSDTLDSVNKNGMRYLLRVSSLVPLAHGIAVQPQSYRIGGITAARTIVVPLPGSTAALCVLAATRDGYVEMAKRFPVRNGAISVEVSPKSDLDHVLLIYPVTEGLEMPDLWEGLDAHRDQLLTSLRVAKLGTGLRGIVNPLGRTLSLPGKDFSFVPTSPAFRLELAQFLETKYRNMETALRSWSVTGFSSLDEKNQPTSTFQDLAKLVPLWNGSRGIPQMWDPETDKLYSCEKERSAAWKDIGEAINAAGMRRVARMVAAIHSVADVPVIQEWSGWAAPYENAQSPLDGIGALAVGTTPDQTVQSVSRATSSVLRWSSPGWLVATSVSGVDDKSLPIALDTLGQIGDKGFFVEARTDALLKAVSLEASRRTADIAQIRVGALYYPENATNPAQPQRLPGGQWWLPTPADGMRIDLGPDYKAYRMNLNGAKTLAIWTRNPGRVKLRMASTAGVTFTTIDGSTPKLKTSKTSVEVDLTDYPILVSNTDEIPVPEQAYKDLTAKFAKLIGDAQAKHLDATEERIAFQQAATGFERNPGGSYIVMLDQYYRAAQRLGTFTWIEAERAQDTNFSEGLPLPAASNGMVLSLRTPFPPDREYYADYTLPVRSEQDQTVWLAARIPQDQRRFVQAMIGGQTLTLSEVPINGYGDGFAWYRLGTTRLTGGSSKVRITVNAPDGADLALDAILLTPSSFVPNGVTPPDPLSP